MITICWTRESGLPVGEGDGCGFPGRTECEPPPPPHAASAIAIAPRMANPIGFRIAARAPLVEKSEADAGAPASPFRLSITKPSLVGLTRAEHGAFRRRTGGEAGVVLL